MYTVKKCSCIALFFICLVLIFSCQVQPKLSPMQKRQLTTRMFECEYECGYRSSLTVLQDQGYVIKNTDMDSGLILASVDRKTSGGSQVLQALAYGFVADKGTDVEVSCVVDKLNESTTEIRINIEEVKYGQSSAYSGTSKQSSKQIYDANMYRDLFNEIRVEIYRRQAMRGESPDEEKESVPSPSTETSGQGYEARGITLKNLKAKVITPQALIRLYADRDSDIIATVPSETILYVDQEVQQWYRVTFLQDEGQNKLSGYIEKGRVAFIYEESRDSPLTPNVVIPLNDGSSLKAQLINETEEELTVKTNLGMITIERSKVKKIEWIDLHNQPSYPDTC